MKKSDRGHFEINKTDKEYVKLNKQTIFNVSERKQAKPEYLHGKVYGYVEHFHRNGNRPYWSYNMLIETDNQIFEIPTSYSSNTLPLGSQVQLLREGNTGLVTI